MFPLAGASGESLGIKLRAQAQKAGIAGLNGARPQESSPSAPCGGASVLHRLQLVGNLLGDPLGEPDLTAVGRSPVRESADQSRTGCDPSTLGGRWRTRR